VASSYNVHVQIKTNIISLLLPSYVRIQAVPELVIQMQLSLFIYRVIHKSLRYFRPPLYRSRDGHAEGEHVNRGRDTPSFCPTLQVLDMSTLGDAEDVNPVIKFMPYGKSCGIGGTYTCSLCHVIYHSCDEGSWRQSLLSTARSCNV
jgi:hypothetical protein